MNVRSAKAKGRRLAERFRQLILALERTLTIDDVFVNPSSLNGEDLLLSPKAREIFPFAVECKNQERIDIWSAIAQAEGHAEGTERVPIVVFSRNHAKDYVICEAETFLKQWGRGL